MNVAEIAAVVLLLAAVAVFVVIFRSFRTTKAQRQWEERERQVVVKHLPSFDVYSAKDRRSRAIEAANKR